MPGAFPQWRNCGEKFAQRIATLTFSAPGLYYSISTRFHGAYAQLFRLLHSARVSNSYFPALPAVLSSYTLRTFHRLCDDRFLVIFTVSNLPHCRNKSRNFIQFSSVCHASVTFRRPPESLHWPLFVSSSQITLRRT